MAAEDDGAKGGKSAGERRRGRERRQRPPVTIDLTAEHVAAGRDETDRPEPAGDTAAERPEVAPPQPPGPTAAPPSGDAGPKTTAEAPRAIRPPGASAIGSDDGWMRPVLAGAAAALAIIVLVMALQGIGLVPAPGRSAATAAVEQAKAASEAVAGLDRRISAVEMMTEGLSTTRSTVDALTGRVTGLETAADQYARKDAVTALDGQVAALSTLIDALPPGVSQDDLARLAERVGRLEAGAAGAAGDGEPGAAAVAALSGRIADTEAALKALAARVAALESRPGTGEPGAGTLAARAIAVATLRRAAGDDRPFTADLDLAAALGIAAEDVAALRPLAETGAPTRANLAAAFPAVGNAILNETVQSDPDAGLLDRLIAGIGNLISVRPTGPVAGDAPAAVVSRMRAAVDGGDLETALKERDGLPPAGQKASAEWAAKARDRVAIDALVAKIAGSVGPAAGNGPT